MVIKPRTSVVTAFCALMFAAACYLLGFGGVLFCCAPSGPGGRFWQREKFFYGLLPMCAGIAVFTFTFRLWAHAFTRRRNAWLVGCIVVIFALILDFSLFWKYRGKQDERIELAWKVDSGVFSWGSGNVTLPGGFAYKTDHGIDTVVGHFTSQDGKLVIEHDIGEVAGEHGGMGQSETLIEGSRVRVGSAINSNGKGKTTFFSKMSFPDSGCANFYLESPDEKDAAIIKVIAESFRPKGWTPAWVRPLLPEILRSDCRYRLELPAGFETLTLRVLDKIIPP